MHASLEVSLTEFNRKFSQVNVHKHIIMGIIHTLSLDCAFELLLFWNRRDSEAQARWVLLRFLVIRVQNSLE